MAGHSVPIDFWTEPEKISNPVERVTLLQDFLPIVEPFSGALKKITDGEIPGGHHFFLYSSETMSLSVKMYSNGLVSTTLEYFVPEASIHEQKIALDDGRQIEDQLQEKLGSRLCRVLPAIKRAPPINPYFTTSDDRLLEYNVDKVVFEGQSEFQKVQILCTKSYGNILFLDDLQNLGESDISYTHGLMNKPNEDFKGKEILILGGGDGALLWELLKEDPAYVTVIDIDEMVIKACRKYMRSVCGTCLDSYEGKNYKVIIGDAIAHMKTYITEERKFDYVFGDLTDIPISKTPRGELWDFIRKIINLGTQCMRQGTGKYMTHATGIHSESALKMFEEQMENLELPVVYTRTSCFVPSFMENWCFYQITAKNSS